MDKKELVERLAKQSHQSKGKAADQVDTLVYGLLKELKQKEDKPSKTIGGAPKPPSSSPSPCVKDKK
ncbi:MAG: hypothetical protein JO182_32135 [Acidobacteriaceae bacterium]|nr:hypothetical protein [Acidobacteriaceae bacterium]